MLYDSIVQPIPMDMQYVTLENHSNLSRPTIIKQ